MFVNSTLPFSHSWRSEVDEKDIGKFVVYRKRMLILYGMNLIVFALLVIIVLNFESFYNVRK